MWKYVIKRILLGIFVVFGVILITFVLTRVLPSDPVAKMIGTHATPEQKEAAFISLGLDRPIWEQFLRFLSDLMHGNLGTSLRTKTAVTTELANYIPATVEIVLFAMILAIVLGIPLGISSAHKKDHWLDHFCRFFSVAAVSLPTFVVALGLQLVFYRMLNILPLGGQLDTKLTILHHIDKVTGLTTVDCMIAGDWTLLWDALKHMIMPGITIALYPLGLVAKMTRASLIEILGEDYIRAARSYGLEERLVLWGYALKNSLGTTVTVVATCIGYTLINTFLVETIFNWPGLGNYVSTSITNMDSPAIIGATLFSSIVYVVLNLIADLIIATDPRVRI